MAKFVLYIDIATFVNEKDRQFVKNSLRKEQICNGLKKLFTYDFESKGCDILLSDNTCEKLPEEIDSLLPPSCKRRCFNHNPYGTINKGAGLIQKWEYNEEFLNQYEYILHFEGRLLLQSFSFFDSFFENPRTLFRYGSLNPLNTSHYFTGLFAVRSKDLFVFCKKYPKEKLIQHCISIEYPMKDFFQNDAFILPCLDLTWFPASGEIVSF